MYTLDPELTLALRRTTVSPVARITALWPDGTDRRTFDLASSLVLSGTTTADLRRDVRRSCSMSLDNSSGLLAPALADDLFAKGSRIRIERGAVVNRTRLYATLLTGFVSDCVASMAGVIDLTVESYMSALAQEAGTAFVIPAGTFLPDVLTMLWEPVLPTVPILSDETAVSRSVGADIPVLASDIRLDFGLRLARDLGCVAYDDRDGRIVVEVRPDPTTQATDRTMTDPLVLSRSSGRMPVNAQPVECTPGDGEPFSVLVEIDDPTSPYHRDRIGLRMAPVVRSDSISDPATARDMAARLLAARSMAQDALSTSCLPEHLDLDEGDIIERTEPVSGTSGRYLVETISYPVGPGDITTTETSVVPLYLSDL